MNEFGAAKGAAIVWADRVSRGELSPPDVDGETSNTSVAIHDAFSEVRPDV